MKTYTEKELLNYAAALCSRSEHCIKEISEKLDSKQASETVVKNIVTNLVREGYIDESRYAKAFVRDKYRFDKWGTKKIKQTLHYKNISDDNIRRALGTIDRKEYLSNLKTLLQVKKKNIHARNDYEMNGKLIRFAVNKGYEISDIQQTLDDSFNFEIQ